MPDLEAIGKAVVTVGAPLLAVVSVGSRKNRLRREIKENLALIDDVDKHHALSTGSLASAWLQGRVALDIARLTDQKFGAQKKPIDKSAVVFAAVLGVGLAVLTYWINRSGFRWYSVFPGVGSFLFAVSIFGMTTNREILEEDEALPPGAVSTKTDSAQEQVATTVVLTAIGALDERYLSGGQVNAVQRFISLSQEGNFDEAIKFVDKNWLRCRIYSWLWSRRDGDDSAALSAQGDAMLETRQDHPAWLDFSTDQAVSLIGEFAVVDLNSYGFGSARRRVAQDLDVVVLVPTGTGGGFYVSSATYIAGARPFLVSRDGGEWRVANHVSAALPAATWPPIWWVTDDSDIYELPE